MEMFDTHDIIYALATPFSTGAVAIIRISGNGCIKTLSSYFSAKKKLLSCKSNSMVFGRIEDKQKKAVDEVVLLIYKDGHGYTGEEAVEISCHGSPVIIQEILNLLSDIGFRPAKGGEFTLRAFLHGKMDLTRAEAVNELIKSQSNEGKDRAYERLSGVLENKIKEIRNLLLDVMAGMEVQLDYAEDEESADDSFPEEKIRTALKKINEIRSTYNRGKLYSQRSKVVLSGPSNAGKSSLFNILLKEERSIVSSSLGTTRDYIQADCSIEGLPVSLYDTAGLRESNSEVEQEGIKRTNALMRSADVIVYVQDGSLMYEKDFPLLKDKRTIAVLNKADLKSNHEEPFISVSAKEGLGIDVLCAKIKEKLTKESSATSIADVVIESERQKAGLDEASSCLETALQSGLSGLPLDITAVSILDAANALGTLTGEVTSDDVLDRIFSGFCVGK